MLKKVKLLILTAGLSSNGTDMFVFNVMKSIDKSKYDITVIIAIDDEMECINEAETKHLGIRVLHACDLDTSEKKKRYFAFVRSEMERGSYDVVHAHMDMLNGILLYYAKKSGIKTRICHAHTSANQFAINSFKDRISLAVRKAYALAMKRMIKANATALAGCSDVANRYFYGSKADEAVVIYNGIELARFSPDGKCRYEGISDAVHNIVTVGRISMAKNPEMIVDIIYELSKKRSDFCLNWVGTGDMQDFVKELAEKKKVAEYINFMGLHKDVADILPSCDYFILPSLFEGLPIVLVEAQAAGLTCFVSDTVTKMVQAGACVYLPIGNAKAWADEIDRAIESSLRLSTDKDKIQKFDISYTVRQLDELYAAKSFSDNGCAHSHN